jgi:hypothetical protein
VEPRALPERLAAEVDAAPPAVHLMRQRASVLSSIGRPDTR